MTTTAETEDLPDDPPMPFEQRLIQWQAPVPSHVEARRGYLEEDGSVVAVGYSKRWPEEDPENAFVWMTVAPPHRRRGMGTMLFDRLLADIEEAGSKKVIVDCTVDRPWEGTLERWGMARSLNEKYSRLHLADVDWDLMDRWIQRAEERAADYQVISVDFPIPEELLDRWCRVKDVMNTAPLENLDLADRRMTPTRWREIEVMHRGRGDRLLAVVAMHRPSGDFVGFTDVSVPRHQPHQAYQQDTAVDPAHREKGLGRWIKATMMRRIADEHPQVTRIDTANAGSNDAMLGINIEMGFQPILLVHAWQGDIATIRSNLVGV